MPDSLPRLTVSPWDTHNRELVGNVHPPDWVNPKPASRYNLVVLGAGTAGLVTAAGAAGLGAGVALVEKHLMGGDCLNVGCVPSKCLIRSSRAAADVRGAGELGVHATGAPQIDFAAVMERMRRLRAGISRHDSAQRFRDLGVDVFLGEARFSGRDTVEVGGAVLRFKKAVIATGARAAAPPIEGLREAGFLTNETVFSLTERPRRLAVIGGGPIGCELAQAFQRLGAQVTLFHNKSHVLDREDPDAAEVLQKRFVREGMRLVLNSRITGVTRGSEGRTIRYQSNGNTDTATVDEILVAAGRAPNVEGLNLETAGVQYDLRDGVRVNDRLQTTNPRIYGCGDVCLKWKFTHAADAAARIVIQNALFLGRKKVSSLVIPWCTYTDPEIAHVGLTERQAQERGIALDTFVQPMKDVDRSIADAETEGFVKVHARRGIGRILGATIVARHAGEMIGELTLAIQSGIGLGRIANLIHPYPTQAEAIKKAADAYNRTRLTPSSKRLLEAWLSWTR